MIPGDPTCDAQKALDLEHAVGGFRVWLDRHKEDPLARFTFEVREGRFFGVETTAVAWYSRENRETTKT